ncbi:MAG: transcription-repair coupling factor [Planctomycetia bacterium]|nr:transcription-repair coupling factor [Planctomycetia bacterium]
MKILQKNSVSLSEIVESIRSLPGFSFVRQKIWEQKAPHFDGVWSTSAAAVLAALEKTEAEKETSSHPGETFVVLTSSQKKAEGFLCDLKNFTSTESFLLPWFMPPIKYTLEEEVLQDGGPRHSLTPEKTEKEKIENELFRTEYLPEPAVGQRFRVLRECMTATKEKSRIIVAPIQALLKYDPKPEIINENLLKLKVGQEFSLETLISWLVEHGFHRTAAVELPGEFSAHGGLVDIFAQEWENPIRVEFFGEEIDTLREFEISTQRSLSHQKTVEIGAVTTLLENRGREQRTDFTEFLPENTCFFMLEPEEIQIQGRHFLQVQERPEDFFTVEEIFRRVMRFPLVTGASLENMVFGETFRIPVETVERFSGGDLTRVKKELEIFGAGQEIFIICQNDAEIRRLKEVFADTEPAKLEKLNFRKGVIEEGFRLISSKQLILSAAIIFQREELLRTVSRRMTKVIDSFSDLREGDLVVHAAHGIAVYKGMKLLEPFKFSSEKKSQFILTAGERPRVGAEEHLLLEFRGGTQLWVPASKIALVQKYICGGGGKPKLSVYGGKKWEHQKALVAESIHDFAEEMIEIQALRRSRPGISFPVETLLQKEFAEMFPYTETADQNVSVCEISEDMRKPVPMDRLLCGDVGFGKTEVAMRAAFCAVEAGYQVAVLVPTTILAEQHLRTFTQRMATFPVNIARMSRFARPAEQQKTLKDLENGKVDIIIGTHRLASSDVKFHNLGLLIIDEEQRFGVEVKESLKRFRATVDILTMTATPIPRTLHMSLLGIRDISNLETPPQDRMAVETHVVRFHDGLVKNALERELDRNGQVFFVHNRISDIQQVAQRLQDLVPEARIRVGHAQMDERELENVMLAFVRHECDILVSTTIVENGLDIPNANTIFIDDAQNYGLADLHQLRGRVGRYKNRAYCYLLLDPKTHLASNAAKRLRAIEEYSHLGSGFRIAMRDLEIRGTGNILGVKQSGHIAAVGYEMYCELLDKIVRKLKREPMKETVDVDVDLSVTAYIPHSYVPDMRVKIDLYRRLTRVVREEELDDFTKEIRDRFGKIPPQVERLLELARLRIYAHRWLIYAIRREEDYLVFHFYSEKALEPLLNIKVGKEGGKLRIADAHSAYLPLDKETQNASADSDKIIKYAEMLLR